MNIINIEQHQLSQEGKSIFNLGYFIQDPEEFTRNVVKISKLKDTRDIGKLLAEDIIVDQILITAHQEDEEENTVTQYFKLDGKHINLINYILVKN